MELDLLDLYQRASEWTETKVAGATGQLDAADAVRRVGCSHAHEPHGPNAEYFVGAARGEDVSPPSPTPPELLGDDPVAVFDQACSETVRTFEEPGVIEKTGPALGIAFSDQLLHGWDLAASTGQTTTMPQDLPEAAYTLIHGRVHRRPAQGRVQARIESPPTLPRRTSFSRIRDATRTRPARRCAERGVPNRRLWTSNDCCPRCAEGIIRPNASRSRSSSRLGRRSYLSADHVVVDRRRIGLVEPGFPSAPIHHEGGAFPLHRPDEPLDDNVASRPWSSTFGRQHAGPRRLRWTTSKRRCPNRSAPCPSGPGPPISPRTSPSNAVCHTRAELTPSCTAKCSPSSLQSGGGRCISTRPRTSRTKPSAF